MKSRRGKRVAWCLTGVGLLVILACGVAFKDRAVEQYWLWKLESDEIEEQEAAAEKLGELKSVKAVPFLLDRLLVETDEHLGDRIPVGISSMGVEHGTVVGSWDYQDYVGKALVRTGVRAGQGMVPVP